MTLAGCGDVRVWLMAPVFGERRVHQVVAERARPAASLVTRRWRPNGDED